MVNHPNRKKGNPYAQTPTPEQVTAARERAGLTQVQAAELIFSTYRTWHNYEVPRSSAEHRRMHPALFALFLLFTEQSTLAEYKRAQRAHGVNVQTLPKKASA